MRPGAGVLVEEPGVAYLPLRGLTRFLRRAESETVSVSTETGRDERLFARLTAGEYASTFPARKLTDWPAPPAPLPADGPTIAATELRDAIDRALVIVRPALPMEQRKSLYFHVLAGAEGGGRVSLVVSDGYRASVEALALDGSTGPPPLMSEVDLVFGWAWPDHAAALLRPLLSSGRVRLLGSERAGAGFGVCWEGEKEDDGVFRLVPRKGVSMPPYEELFARMAPRGSFSVDRAALLAALSRVTPEGGSRLSVAVTITVEEGRWLRLEAQSLDLYSYSDRVAAEVEGDFETTRLSLSLFREAATLIPDARLKLSWSGPKSPVCFRSEEIPYSQILMPCSMGET